MYLIFTFREFKSIHKGKTAILHLCFGTEKNRRLVAKKPDIIGLFAGDIFLSPHYGGPEGIRTLDLSDANELKALICIDFQTFPALSAGM